MANYYETLGVSKTATQDEIKSAYRKLVKQYHPDLHPGDAACAAKFKEINEANEVLSDPEKRKQYDFQQEHPNMGGFGGFSGGGFSGSGDFGGFGDIFGDIFSQFTGGGRAEEANKKGPRRHFGGRTFVSGRGKRLQKRSYLRPQRTLRGL